LVSIWQSSRACGADLCQTCARLSGSRINGLFAAYSQVPKCKQFAFRVADLRATVDHWHTPCFCPFHEAGVRSRLAMAFERIKSAAALHYKIVVVAEHATHKNR
jgi:hypothetical protein